MKKNIALVIIIIVALVMFGCSSDEKNYVENNPDTTRDGSNSWLAGLITRVPVLFGVGDGPLTNRQVRSKSGAACTQVLDSVPAGSLSTWIVQNTGGNPIFSYTEITSPYDGSTAIQTSVNGYTYSQCPSQYIEKTYTVSGNALTSDLKAYLAFTSTLDYYNFPYVLIILYDEGNNVVGSHIYYGKGVIGGLYASYVASDPTSYTELPSAAGYQTLDLSPMGDVSFAKIGVRISNYACVGSNSVTLDQLSIESNCGGGSSRSSLYWINTVTGSATMIGDIGYIVEGIAYDAITNKLYGITSPFFKQGGESQLIEIDMATGAGSLIGTITPGEDYFSNPTFNALGTLYAVNNNSNRLCTINLTTAEADCFGNTEAAYAYKDLDDFGPLNLKNRGLAFNNIDVLNLIVPDYVKEKYKGPDPGSGARVYTYNADHMKFDYQRTIYGLPYNMAPNGDFDPLTGIYWGLDSLDAVFVVGEYNVIGKGDLSGKNLLVIDINNGTLMQTIPTIDNLHAITFGYLNASTLIKMGLNDLINFLKPNNPE
jgi:hypothetical protein